MKEIRFRIQKFMLLSILEYDNHLHISILQKADDYKTPKTRALSARWLKDGKHFLFQDARSATAGYSSGSTRAPLRHRILDR